MPKFKYVVRCSDKESCKIVRQNMKNDGYKYIREIRALSGDHTAIKELPSLDAARKEAKTFYKKHIDEISQISLISL